LKYWIALNLLAQQTIGVIQKERPPRATRRRAEKWNKVDGARYISLITLRKKKSKNNEDPKDVPWTHRWVVGGHWRKQWYPKEQTHRYIYIYDYVKGPEHLPLVVRERRVFNFAR